MDRHGLVDPATPDMAVADRIGRRRQAVATFLEGLATWGAVEQAMAAMNLAWGAVWASRDLEDHPTVRARGSIVQIDDRAGGTRPIPQSPYRFSAARSGVQGPAAHRGEHNEAVLTEWLGLGASAIAGLSSAGVLLAEP
jgi:crotonobetainyl-CoA:carnitine CoA-transferase CaiB-like acyl-CoA transferase